VAGLAAESSWSEASISATAGAAGPGRLKDIASRPRGFLLSAGTRTEVGPRGVVADRGLPPRSAQYVPYIRRTSPTTRPPSCGRKAPASTVALGGAAPGQDRRTVERFHRAQAEGAG